MSQASAENFMTIVDNNSAAFSSVPLPPNRTLSSSPSDTNIGALNGFQMPLSSMAPPTSDQPPNMARFQVGDNAEVHLETVVNHRRNESSENEAARSGRNEPLRNVRVIHFRLPEANNMPRFSLSTVRVGRDPATQSNRMLVPESPEWRIQARQVLVDIRERYRNLRRINPHSFAYLHRKKSKYTKKGSQKTSFHKYMLHYMNACQTNNPDKDKAHPRLIKKRHSHR